MSSLDSVVKLLKHNGLLLESDPSLPSITFLVAGERIKGSWWGHAKGREIWHVLIAFTERKDVLVTRLVSGKVTFVHRALWDDFIAIATSKERWQTRHLSIDAKRLFGLVENEGLVRTDFLTPKLRLRGTIGDAARELEKRLLIHTDEVHTEKGSHAKILESWSYWLHALNLQPKQISPTSARARFEVIVGTLNVKYHGDGSLPWAAEHEQ